MCLLAYQRGEESYYGLAGGVLMSELLDTVRAWREANTKK